VPARHPKATKRRRDPVAPADGPDAASPARPAQPVRAIDPVDAGPPPRRARASSRPQCAAAGHWEKGASGRGAREARSCKVCAVLHVDECAALAGLAPGAPAELVIGEPDGGPAFDVLQRVARTASGTYWCPHCLAEALLEAPERRARLVGTARLAEAGAGDEAAALRKELKSLFQQANKCEKAAHVAARNGGLCRCAVEPRIEWRRCRVCRAARAHPYAGLD
jgi:hypothetical protein